MNATLKEIIKLAKETLAVTEASVLNEKVEDVTKTAFVSVGGKLDSIVLLAEDALTLDPTQDNIDRPTKHNIAGGMNSPSKIQTEAFELENKDEV